MSANNENKIQIKPIGGKLSSAFWVYPIDAKEILAQGKHETVGKSLPGSADWLPENESGESEENELTEDKINSMVTKDLFELVKNQELEIEGFDKMNLAEKRKAVIAAIFVEDDGDL